MNDGWHPNGVTARPTRVTVLSLCVIDVRPGGKWRGRLRAVDGSRELDQGGEYREVKEPERLAFTFYWDQDDGSRGKETLVEIDFAERGSKTLMRFAALRNAGGSVRTSRNSMSASCTSG